MLFHTAQFGFFLVLVLALSALLSRRRQARHGMLLLASYVFYMAWDVRYLALILFSTLLDYVVGAAIHGTTAVRRRKHLLAASLAGNLGVLAVFKYYGFFAESLHALFQAVGFDFSLPALRILLPVGISFYTFQSLSYTIDIYRGRLEPRRSFVEFALFVAFFPQLVAGPIVRASQFLPQLDRLPEPNETRTGSGIYLVLKGLVKKVLIADMLGRYLVDPVFDQPHQHGALLVLTALYAFKFQIYNDFSGYSDIAIGCGRLLGFELPENFRSPYKADSIADYWRRWHITLGSWFRDYVFFPLGGSRVGPARAAFNILVTMGLVGLWHGAGWTFVLWGLYYGMLLCGSMLYHRRRSRRTGRRAGPPAPIAKTTPRPVRAAGPTGPGRAARVFFVFQLTTLAALLFRAPDMETVKSMITAPLRSTAGAAAGTEVFLLLALAAVLHFTPERMKRQAEDRFTRLPPAAQGVCIAIVIGLLVTAGSAASPYYYFQF